MDSSKGAIKMTCPICSNQRRKIIINIDGTVLQNWAFCDACEIYSLREMPSEESILRYYTSGAYRQKIHLNRANRMPEAFTYEVILESFRAMHTMVIMKSLGLEPKRFLDVGTSLGILPWGVTRAWRHVECKGEGVEPLGEYVIDKGLTIYNTIDEVTETYDVITCIHTLEHVPSPIEFLSKIANHLEPNGTLIIEVPIYVEGEQYSGFSPGHLYMFTPNGAKNVVEKAGLFAKSYMLHGWPARSGRLSAALVIVEKPKDG